MITKILASAAIILSLVAAILWQHSQINKLKAQNLTLTGNVSALESLRADDQKRVSKYAAQVARISQERATLNSQLAGIRDENTLDFLSLPVPDQLRRAAEAYLAGRTKAASNQK